MGARVAAIALSVVAANALSLCSCGGNTLARQSGVLLDRVPRLNHPVTADLNAMLIYTGLDATPAVARPGQPLKLAHVWEVVASPGRGWKVVTRLQGKGQPEVVADHEATGGVYPVMGWKRGDIVRDEQEVTLPPTWTAPTVTVVVGMVNGPARLPIIVGPRQNENHFVAATINVEPAPAVRP
jgi:hypothetical protein